MALKWNVENREAESGKEYDSRDKADRRNNNNVLLDCGLLNKGLILKYSWNLISILI